MHYVRSYTQLNSKIYASYGENDYLNLIITKISKVGTKARLVRHKYMKCPTGLNLSINSFNYPTIHT